MGNPYSRYTGEYKDDEPLKLYLIDFSTRLIIDPEFRSYVHSLRGKKLGCYCKRTVSTSKLFALDTTPCHAEIVANYLNSLPEAV